MALDEITIQRIKTMHPCVLKEVLEMYEYANEKLLPKGVRLRLTYTLRSNKEQDALYAQGRTKPGRIVTNAKGSQSWHNPPAVLAFDIVMLLDKDGNGTFETASYNVDKHWMKVTNYFKSKGWEWGGDFKSIKDSPHFQKTFGFTLKEINSMPKDKNGYVIF